MERHGSHPLDRQQHVATDGVPVEQVQAAINLLGLNEFHCSRDNVSIVTLFANLFVEYVLMEKLRRDGDDACGGSVGGGGDKEVPMAVADYIYRGPMLEGYSPWQLASEGYKKVKRKQGDDGDGDGEHDNDDVVAAVGKGSSKKKAADGVLFMQDHPQHATHWLFKKAQTKRGQHDRPMVHVTRKARYLDDEQTQRIWVLSVATCWRSAQEVIEKDWDHEINNNESDAMVAMTQLLSNSLAVRRKQKQRDENNDDDDDEVDMVDASQPIAADRVGQRQQQQQHEVVPIVDEEDEQPFAKSIGGESGASAVLSAMHSGLIRPSAIRQDNAHGRIDDDDDEVVIYDDGPPRLKMTEAVYKGLRRAQPDVVDKEDDLQQQQQHVLPQLGKQRVDAILHQWVDDSQVLPRCNAEQKAAIMLCTLSLASSLCNDDKDVANFSAVIQGSGGTGKTQSVIMAVKEFLQRVCDETEDDIWNQWLLIIAPTNLVALAVGGSTIDSGLLNRRAGGSSEPRCSALVKLVMVDEFSMVSLQWVSQISEALQTVKRNNNKEPFGGVSVVWIGDVHQLQPVMGLSVTATAMQATKQADKLGLKLWTGRDWNRRRALSVLMRQQYRMQEPLASMTERFANGQQTLQDAQTLSETRLLKNADHEEWKLRFESGSTSTRILCSDNNSKCALNNEMAKALMVVEGEMHSWRAEDDERLASKSNEVLDQLEPIQFAWKWMPVVCLENIAGTKAVNGALCWVVKVVLKDGEAMPSAVLVIAAESKEDAQRLVGDDDVGVLKRLLDGEGVGAACAREARRTTSNFRMRLCGA